MNIILIWWCTLEFSRGQITPDVKITVEVPSKEFLRYYPNGTINMYVRRGTNMVLECVVFNMPSGASVNFNFFYNFSFIWSIFI